jgi:lysozyme family protein
MIRVTDQVWKDYSRFVLGWEGKGSSDPTDTASQYVKPGQIHTMRGVIWPTFKANAKAIGVAPTYENFLKLTEAQSNQILYQFYLLCKGDKFQDPIGLSLTEFTWGSGLGYTQKAIRKAVRSFGYNDIAETGSINAAVIQAANKINTGALYKKLWADRKAFLVRIAEVNPSQKKFIKGWLNRWKNFQDKFPNTIKAAGIGIGILILGAGLFFLIKKRNATQS